MAKMLKFSYDGFCSLVKGVEILSRAVKATLGPRGRNVAISRPAGSPLSTKDGATVASEISLKDKFENLGCALVKEAAVKTSEVAGDGTTTAIVLAAACIAEGIKAVAAGSHPLRLKRGMDQAAAQLCDQLDALATPIATPEKILQVGTLAANHDAVLGQLVAEAVQKVGKDGTITTKATQGSDTFLDVVEGMRIDRGYLSPYFVTNAEKMQVEFSNVRLLITDKKLSTAADIAPALEKIFAANTQPLCIIADDIEQEALATLVVNKLQGGLSLAAIKAPDFGDHRKAWLQDLAILTGATFISQEAGLALTDDALLSYLGHVKTLKIGKDDATFIDGKAHPDALKERIAQIRHALAKETSDGPRKQLEERLAKLSGGVAVIYVGGHTEGEVAEKKGRVEDAIAATKAALAEGIVPGGGVALIRAAQALPCSTGGTDEVIGFNIVLQAASAPAIAIADNCGKQGIVIADKIADGQGAWGYNGLTNTFVDLLEAGIIDPVFVTKSALRYAVSVAALLLTAEVLLVEKPAQKKGEQSSSTDSSIG